MRFTMKMACLVLALAGVTGCGSDDPPASPPQNGTGTVQARRAPVNGLDMYYELRGAQTGVPLVMLHGGLCTIDDCFGTVLPSFAKTRRVIAIEQQAHGHTGDIERPLSYEQMAEDTVALLGQIGVTNADFFGYSDGGIITLRIATKHPNVIHRALALSALHDNRGYEPGVMEQMEQLTPEMLPPQFRDAYAKVAPDPNGWATLVEKVKRLALDFKGFPDAEVRATQVPIFVIQGDRDIVRPEYAVELYRMLPNAKLAVLPGGDHFSILTHGDTIVSMGTAFFDAP